MDFGMIVVVLTAMTATAVEVAAAVADAFVH